MPIAVVVDWYGPYKTYAELRVGARDWEKGSKVLYMGLEKRDDGTNMANVRYIGLSTNPSTRLQNHTKLRDPSLSAYYIGEISTAGIPGKRKRQIAPDLDAAEGALIALVQPDLNTNRKKPPNDCVVVYSRFFAKQDPWEPERTPVWFPPLVAYNSWSGEWTK
ncbi:hypothetical protein HKX54_08445 [Sulfitobacter sp. M57]|uniref:hypothetical protein n=1 Tax=unclassified Sulfitobacter TaxID=196795 RepID=UPI0023E096DA|nr:MULTISPECIES: hypothetical protein [unclassified Sulfitobacter]MDF3414481.1 hypothetical protein [Sulfitobacter sp. KE5]MDF3421962.1 hypothetical protein [Sulfitobacter sp. KE43]MDF3433027.1 hypothetical protein [Sulfitobacter sp. KE42]MDF3458667.1 hypothetical protein [Sulfitobacter sp. S74]MDF3462567.1 hypothetical protein [Sulfitobacter sp. Ks18]